MDDLETRSWEGFSLMFPEDDDCSNYIDISTGETLDQIVSDINEFVRMPESPADETIRYGCIRYDSLEFWNSASLVFKIQELKYIPDEYPQWMRDALSPSEPSRDGGSSCGPNIWVLMRFGVYELDDWDDLRALCGVYKHEQADPESEKSLDSTASTAILILMARGAFDDMLGREASSIRVRLISVLNGGQSGEEDRNRGYSVVFIYPSVEWNAKNESIEAVIALGPSSACHVLEDCDPFENPKTMLASLLYPDPSQIDIVDFEYRKDETERVARVKLRHWSSERVKQLLS